MQHRSNTRPAQALATGQDDVYARRTIEHTFDSRGDEARNGFQGQGQTEPHPLTVIDGVGAVNPAVGGALTPMQSAEVAAQVITQPVQSSRADILSRPGQRTGHRTVAARITATILAAPLHALPRGQHRNLIALACGYRSNDDALDAFYDEVADAVDSWSRLLLGDDCEPVAGGLAYDEPHLCAPMWRSAENGFVVADLIETSDGPRRDRHSDEVRALFERGMGLYGDHFFGVRAIRTQNLDESLFYLETWHPVALNEVPFGSHQDAS